MTFGIIIVLVLHRFVLTIVYFLLTGLAIALMQHDIIVLVLHHFVLTIVSFFLYGLVALSCPFVSTPSA